MTFLIVIGVIFLLSIGTASYVGKNIDKWLDD